MPDNIDFHPRELASIYVYRNIELSSHEDWTSSGKSELRRSWLTMMKNYLSKRNEKFQWRGSNQDLWVSDWMQSKSYTVQVSLTTEALSDWSLILWFNSVRNPFEQSSADHLQGMPHTAHVIGSSVETEYKIVMLVGFLVREGHRARSNWTQLTARNCAFSNGSIECCRIAPLERFTAAHFCPQRADDEESTGSIWCGSVLSDWSTLKNKTQKIQTVNFEVLVTLWFLFITWRTLYSHPSPLDHSCWSLRRYWQQPISLRGTTRTECHVLSADSIEYENRVIPTMVS